MRTAAALAVLACLSAMATGLIFQDPQFSFQAMRTLGYSFSGGSDPGECLSTCERIIDGNIESWHREWLRTAETVEARADSFLAEGHTPGARSCFFRASEYYRAAEFFLHVNPDDPRLLETWLRSRAAFMRAAALADNPITDVQIPFEDSYLPAYVSLVDDDDVPRPLLIVHSGFDGTREELYFSIGRYANEHGCNALLFEGPGQGQVIREQGIHFRPDWESVVTSVVDYALQQQFTDPERIFLMGYSMGGYFAPRAATGEHRLAGCVASAGLYSIYQSANSSNPMDLDRILDDPEACQEYDQVIYGMMDESVYISWFYGNGMWAFGAESPSGFMRTLRDYTLEGRVRDITCPVLVIDSAADSVTGGQAQMLYDSLSCPKQYILFTDTYGADQHCQMGATRVSNEAMFSWLSTIELTLSNSDQ